MIEILGDNWNFDVIYACLFEYVIYITTIKKN